MEAVYEAIQEDIDSLTKPAGVNFKIASVDSPTSEMIKDQFSGSLRSVFIVVETTPRYAHSEEVRDVRNPTVVRYVDLLAEEAKLVDGVVDAQSVADIIKEANADQIPKTLREVTSLLDELEKDEMSEQRIYDYISEDYTMTVVRLKILDDADAEELVEGLKGAIGIEEPPGVSVALTRIT